MCTDSPTPTLICADDNAGIAAINNASIKKRTK
jgi:hypothetical protein